jgi:hypothetical protein
MARTRDVLHRSRIITSPHVPTSGLSAVPITGRTKVTADARRWVVERVCRLPRQPLADTQRLRPALAKYVFRLEAKRHTKVWVFEWALRFYSARALWTERAWEAM